MFAWRLVVKTVLCAGLLLLLGGCGTVVSMGAQTSDGEQFVGSLTGQGRDYGPIDMRNSSGVECSGIWHMDPQGTGSVSLNCSDGRTGTAELTADDAAGTMKGLLGDKPFSGTFQRSPL